MANHFAANRIIINIECGDVHTARQQYADLGRAFSPNEVVRVRIACSLWGVDPTGFGVPR